MQELAHQYLRTSRGNTLVPKSPFAPVSLVRKRIESFQLAILQLQTGKEHVLSQLPPVPVPTFDGSDSETFLKEFERWMRLTGVTDGSGQLQLDWLIQACTPKVRNRVENVVEEHDGDLVGWLLTET